MFAKYPQKGEGNLKGTQVMYVVYKKGRHRQYNFNFDEDKD